jgi:hypothetical protein
MNALNQLQRSMAEIRRIPTQRWLLTGAASAANWLLDAASLWAAGRAFGITITVPELALLYLGVQVVRQIPLTPAGIGLVDVALLAGFVAAGVARGPAATAVLRYRLLSSWLIIPIGWVVVGVLARSTAMDRQSVHGGMWRWRSMSKPNTAVTSAASPAHCPTPNSSDDLTSAGLIDPSVINTRRAAHDMPAIIIGPGHPDDRSGAGRAT